jgi:hypothetical protein
MGFLVSHALLSHALLSHALSHALSLGVLSLLLCFLQADLLQTDSVGFFAGRLTPTVLTEIADPTAYSIMSQTDAMSLPEPIFRRWTHSREEDQGEIQVYRPTDYEFPPARGREGIEFRRNGEFVFYQIGATDVNSAITGQWQLKDNNVVSVQLPDRATYQLTILECHNRVLKVQS